MSLGERARPAEGEKRAEMQGFSHRYFEVNGTEVHCVVGGSGPAIVLLHGWPYTWAVWRTLMPILAEHGFTVIAPDLRGLGESRLEESGYSKSNVAADVQGVIRSLGFEQIVLLGMDIGTMVAFAYALQYPDQFERLVLTESLLPGFGLEPLMNPADGGYWHFGFHMQVGVAEMLTSGKEAEYLLPTMGMMSLAPDASANASEIYLPSYLQPGRMRAGLKHYETLLEDGKENRQRMQGKLSMPVLVLSGEHGIPHQQTLDSVRQAADRIESDVVPGAGHLFG